MVGQALLVARGWHVFATARKLESAADLASGAITPLLLDVPDGAGYREAVECVLQQAGQICNVSQSDRFIGTYCTSRRSGTLSAISAGYLDGLRARIRPHGQFGAEPRIGHAAARLGGRGVRSG